MIQYLEVWKSIKGYEYMYEVSDMGNVKSLERNVECKYGKNTCIVKRKDKILKWGIDSSGYPNVRLCKNSILKTFMVHLLVWDAFGIGERDGRKVQVDHIDENKRNPAIKNLRLFTNRQNVSSFILNRKKSGLPTGVTYDPKRVNHINKYAAQIYVSGERKHLGRFPTIELAAAEYNKALNTL